MLSQSAATIHSKSQHIKHTVVLALVFCTYERCTWPGHVRWLVCSTLLHMHALSCTTRLHCDLLSGVQEYLSRGAQVRRRQKRVKCPVCRQNFLTGKRWQCRVRTNCCGLLIHHSAKSKTAVKFRFLLPNKQNVL